MKKDIEWLSLEESLARRMQNPMFAAAFRTLELGEYLATSIRERRSRMNYSIDHVSKMSGVPISVIKELEDHMTPPDIDALTHICAVLGLKITIVLENS